LRLRETATSFAEWFDSDNCSSGQIWTNLFRAVIPVRVRELNPF
jgi:hypothetical protein